MTLAYVVTGFPTFSETFIQREVAELLKRGVNLDVYSLRPRHSADHVNVPNPLWEGRCFYVPNRLLRREVLAATAHYGFRGLSVLWGILRQVKSPKAAIKLLAYYPRMLWLARKIAERGYDRIHAHWATLPATAAYVAQALAGVPYSITAHAYDIYTSGEGPFLKEKLRRATHVVTCTQYNLNYLKRLVPERAGRFHLIYHGLNPTDYEAKLPHAERWYALAGGRLVAKKGFHLLLQALHEVRVGRGREIPTIIFGDGPERERLETLKANLGLQEVTFTGRQPYAQVRELMASARVFVVPSVVTPEGDMDGIPNVLVEALASGMPAIGSAISGIPEVVVPGETGWLVEAGDTTGLATCLMEAWDHPETCQRLGERARALVEERFDLRRNAAQLQQLFEGSNGLESGSLPSGKGQSAQRLATEVRGRRPLEKGGAAASRYRPPSS